jgi:hypothetical protein
LIPIKKGGGGNFKIITPTKRSKAMKFEDLSEKNFSFFCGSHKNFMRFCKEKARNFQDHRIEIHEGGWAAYIYKKSFEADSGYKKVFTVYHIQS